MTRVLQGYKESWIPPPIGRVNPGVHCYFNAIISALNSLPTFNERIKKESSMDGSSSFCQFYKKEMDIIMGLNEGDAIKSNLLTIFRRCVDAYDKEQQGKASIKYHVGDRQSDAVEGLDLILQILDDKHPNITELFRYKNLRKYTCEKCEQICLKKFMKEFVHKLFSFKLPDEENGKKKYTKYEIFVYNLIYQIDTFDNYICPICNGFKKTCDDPDVPEDKMDTKNCIRTSGIVEDIVRIIPEIISIQINHSFRKSTKSNVKRAIYFPTQFRIRQSKNSGYIHYKLVSQIEQSGSTQSGHYWARCLRNGKVYTINDENVQESEFKPSVHTVLLIYHHFIPSQTDPYDESVETD